MTKATLYGIPNCNTVKKARDWLEARSVEYHFHDFKKHGAEKADLKRWIDRFGWEKVLNRAGMTWRRLPDEVKETIMDAETAITLMQEKTSIIKRPVLESGGACLLGFDEAQYEQTFTSAA